MLFDFSLQTFSWLICSVLAFKEANEKIFVSVFHGCFYGTVDISDLFHKLEACHALWDSNSS